MNYRHHFHAGNFADVVKHALVVALLRALQKKEKGFLYLDTHAGRGGYDLTAASQGDSLARQPEHPDGIGRLWSNEALPPGIADYVALVREFDRRKCESEAARLALPASGSSPRYYPGSPWLARLLARAQDRLALCEKQPVECAALREEFSRFPRTTVHAMDGYEAVRAMLPPLERRALVLIDPPFEAQDEFAQMAAAVREGLKRLPAGVFALWYPLTERARVEAFFAALLALSLPPTLVAEMTIAGAGAEMKMKGCGVVVVNPPWQFEDTAKTITRFLAQVLAQRPGGTADVSWLVRET